MAGGVCKKCGNVLTGKQVSYCSAYCSKLYLKSQWRKRNRDRIREYNRAYRAKAPDAYFVRSDKERDLLLAPSDGCLRCGIMRDLQLAHIKPHWAGGRKGLGQMIVLCRTCHHAYDEALRAFWAEIPAAR